MLPGGSPAPGLGESAKRSRIGFVSETQTMPKGVVLTDVAVSKVRSLLEAEGRTDLSLRIAVQPGGCSGLRYQLYFDDRRLPAGLDRAPLLETGAGLHTDDSPLGELRKRAGTRVGC